MEIILGVIIGLIISWVFAWVIQPLLFKDKNNIEARFTRIERYLGQADRRLNMLESTSTANTSQLNTLTGGGAIAQIEGNFSRKHKFGLRFQQTMGVVFILKPFIPLILLLILGLFGYLMVNDIRNDDVISQSVNQVTTNIEAVQTELQTLGNTLNNLKADFGWLESVIGVLSDIITVIGGAINGIISVLNSVPLIPDIPLLSIEIPGFRNISKSIEDLVAISDATQAIINEVQPLYDSVKVIVLKWWGYAKLLFFLIVGWLGLLTLSSAYWNISRGLEMIRQKPRLMLAPSTGQLPQKTKTGHLLKSGK